MHFINTDRSNKRYGLIQERIGRIKTAKKRVCRRQVIVCNGVFEKENSKCNRNTTLTGDQNICRRRTCKILEGIKVKIILGMSSDMVKMFGIKGVDSRSLLWSSNGNIRII